MKAVWGGCFQSPRCPVNVSSCCVFVGPPSCVWVPPWLLHGWRFFLIKSKIGFLPVSSLKAQMQRFNSVFLCWEIMDEWCSLPTVVCLTITGTHSEPLHISIGCCRALINIRNACQKLDPLGKCLPEALHFKEVFFDLQGYEKAPNTKMYVACRVFATWLFDSYLTFIFGMVL